MGGMEDSVFSIARYAGSLRQFRTQSLQRLGNTIYLRCCQKISAIDSPASEKLDKFSLVPRVWRKVACYYDTVQVAYYRAESRL